MYVLQLPNTNVDDWKSLSAQMAAFLQATEPHACPHCRR